MNIEIDRANKTNTSPELLGSINDQDLTGEILADVENGVKPSGRDFVDIVREDPATASDILDAVCAASGASPSNATEIAEQFQFNSIEEVEYFFAHLA